MTRQLWILVHRWVGLTIAAFLFVSGITGAVISWDHELDDVLNPQLTHVASRGEFIPTLDLAREIEERDPRVFVTYAPLAPTEGEAVTFGVSAHVDPETRRLYDVGYNEVFVDPVTGAELGRREWGAVWPVTKENFVSFLYVLHYSLHIPELWGTDRWGLWLLGIVAILWALDCFVGFYLTLPARRRSAGDAPAVGKSWWQRWTPAWKVRWRAGPTKLNFDVHRAFSLWTWVLLFIVAFTAFSLNLYSEVFYPLMSKVSEVTPSPYDVRTPADHHAPILPTVSYAALVEAATVEAQRRGWDEPAGSVYYSPEFGIQGVEFYFPGADHGSGGVGHKTLFYDGTDGRYLGDSQPWRGTAADLFVQAQFPLHSGRILGLPGRILISLMGLIVAVLSVTGVVIWAKKRAARVLKEARGAVRASESTGTGQSTASAAR